MHNTRWELTNDASVARNENLMKRETELLIRENVFEKTLYNPPGYHFAAVC